MICPICRQAQTIDGLTSVSLARGEIRFAVEKVPAQVCPSCGEAYLAEGVADRVLQAAERRMIAGQLIEAWNYDF